METPGPIPNPEAKPVSADGTALGRVWESRTSPDILSIRAIPQGMALIAFSGQFNSDILAAPALKEHGVASPEDRPERPPTSDHKKPSAGKKPARGGQHKAGKPAAAGRGAKPTGGGRPS